MTTTASTQGVSRTRGERADAAEETRDIFDIAQTCKDLFPNLQQQRFYVWASYLGVFAPFNASLDKRLQYSDEIRSLVVQMLSVLRRNLEFLASTDHDVSACDKVTSISGLDGTPSEALEAIEASINRLNRLGATIRKYSVSGLDERVNAFTRRHGDENYTQLARHIVRFKYKTATPSLQEHLALSMSSRRQRLRYLHRHQSKLASHINTTPSERTEERTARALTPLAPIGEDTEGEEQQLSQAPMREVMALRRRQLGHSPMHGGRSETNASKFVPTPSVVAKLRRGDGASVVSSSKKSSTFMAEAIEDYPDPPKRLPDQPEPLCPYCCQPLEERERVGVKWVHHVNKDLCPFICLSNKCAQGPHIFQDFSTWAKHMRDAHTTKWPQQIHKPLIWACDVDHDMEEFSEEGQFQQHLASQHSDCTKEEKHAIAESCQMPHKRLRNVCPVCGYDLSNNESPVKGAPEIQVVDEFAQLDLMAKHVAGHLRQLAFDSSKNLEDQIETTSEISLVTSKADLMDRDSEVRRPSDADALDDIPSVFSSTETNLGYLPKQNMSSYDGQWSPAEIEILLKFPEDLTPSAVQEWSEIRREVSKLIDADLDTGTADPIIKDFQSRQTEMYLKLKYILRASPCPKDDFIAFNKARVFRTGDSMLKDEGVRAWLHGDKPFLWVSGATGTGKSLLMTRLLAWGFEDLPHIGYFDFQGNSRDTRSVLQALRDIACQISKGDAFYCKQLLKLIDSTEQIRTIPSAFRRLLVEPFQEDLQEKTIYIFLDDVEAARQDQFRELLKLLADLRADHVSAQLPVHHKI